MVPLVNSDTDWAWDAIIDKVRLDEIAITSTVKTAYNDHPGNPKIVAIVITF